MHFKSYHFAILGAPSIL